MNSEQSSIAVVHINTFLAISRPVRIFLPARLSAKNILSSRIFLSARVSHLVKIPCVRNAVCSIEVSSGPQNLRVSIVLKASKSAGATGDVPKIYGFVNPLHPC